MCASATLGGCAYGGDGETVSEVQDPLYVSTSLTLFTANDWEVPVCFHPASGGSASARDVFKTAVKEQWEANTGLTFTGFETCTSTASPWVPVYFRTNTAGNSTGAAVGGVGQRWSAQTAQDNNWPQDSQVVIDYFNEAGIPYPAVHEMGHVIGVAHEHQRSDGDDVSNRCVVPRPPFGDGAIITPNQTFATVDDPLSIMHYCWMANGQTNSGVLSALDIIGGQMLYGRPASATAELGFQTTRASGIPPQFSFNSTGATNSFIHLGTGQYQAHFPRLGRVGGNVQVTPRNTINRCNISSWASGGGGSADAFVNCYTPAGAFADTEFTVSFVGRSDPPTVPEGGYVWAFDKSAASYVASGGYTWNSTGQPVNITRGSAGVYNVTFVGQNFGGGTAEVTAYGGGTEYCKLESLTRVNNNADKRVVVRCFSRTGVPTDAHYSLRLSRVSPQGTPSFTYALADQPSTQSYNPSSNNRMGYRASPIGGSSSLSPVRVQRTAPGIYAVDLPQMPYTNDPLYLYKKSNIHVAAVGTGAEYCSIANWNGDPLGQPEQATQALINCMNPQGGSVDSKFIISYGSMLVDRPDSTILATVERLPQNGALGVGGLSLVDGSLFFTRSFDNVTGGQIMRLDSGSHTPSSVVSGQSALGLYADSSNLIWVGSNGSVKKSSLSGGSILTLASNQPFVSGNPTADANNVFYFSKANAMDSAVRIMKVARNGGTPTVVTTDEVTSGLFSDGTSVYYAARTPSGGGRIVKVPVGGGAVTVLATKGGGALVRRSSTLYYVDAATNDLYKVMTSGGASTRIATGMGTTIPVTE